MSKEIIINNKENVNTNVSDFISYTEGDVELTIDKNGDTWLEDYKGNCLHVDLSNNADVLRITQYGLNDNKIILDHFIDFTEGNVEMMSEETYEEMLREQISKS